MRRARHPWTLQRRLIVTIAAIVSLILILVGVATSAILGSVLERSLDSQVEATANRAATWIRPIMAWPSSELTSPRAKKSARESAQPLTTVNGL